MPSPIIYSSVCWVDDWYADQTPATSIWYQTNNSFTAATTSTIPGSAWTNSPTVTAASTVPWYTRQIILPQVLFRVYQPEPQVAPRIARPHVRDSRSQAEVQARDLLLRCLSSEQRASLERDKWFVVEGRSGRRYRVRDIGHTVANIDVLEGERVTHRLCGHLHDGAIPLADHLLAQKLMLEGDEESFLQLANRHAAGGL